MGQPYRKMRFSYSKCEWFRQRFGRLNSQRVKSVAEKSSKLNQVSCKDYEPAAENLHFDVHDLSFSKLDQLGKNEEAAILVLGRKISGAY